MKRVCIIGAGMAGLCAARHALQNNIEPIVYEQNDRIGGTWIYTDETKTNKYGIDIHTSMYQGLRTNLPKEIMGYPDFPVSYSDDISYIPSQGILDFLEQYAEVYQLKQHIKFLHYVIRIRPRGQEWEVIVKDLPTGKIEVQHFDFVLVCNGHYHTPKLPNIKGSEIYKGRTLHSHEYRHARIFEGESVLIIGAGPSGMDLCHEISKYAKRVTLSHRMSQEHETIFRPNVTRKPEVTRFNETGAYFVNDSYESFSSVLYCTGFQYSFPFLSTDCGIFIKNNHVQPLYKHCINIKFPTMAFIGIPHYICSGQMIDLQSRFAFKYFTKQKQLPTEEEMLTDTTLEIERRAKMGFDESKSHMMGPDQIYYFESLAKTADIEGIKPVMTYLLNESFTRFKKDLLNFRKDVFRIVDDETFEQIA